MAANPLYIYQHPDEINEVRIISDPRDSESEGLAREFLGLTSADANYTYGELSPRAKELFDRARNDSGNRTRFYGDDRRPADFDFADENESGAAGNWYRVERGGDTYYVWAFAQSSTRDEEQRRSQALVGLGLTLLLAGGLYAWRGNQPMAIGVTLGVLGGMLLLLNVAYRFARDLLGPLNALGGSVFVLLVLLFGIAGAGYLGYLTARERFGGRPRTAGDRS